jgi:hypothetical protein
MSDVISGKVAAIIDDITLVLNVGYEDGVRGSMAFAIFAEQRDIEDPDTGESLGKWEMVKARVEVTHVQAHMCTVSPSLVEPQAEGSSKTLSAMMVEHSFGRGAECERLDVRTADISGQPKMQPIAVGDGARSLVVDVAEDVATVESAVAEAGGDADKP